MEESDRTKENIEQNDVAPTKKDSMVRFMEETQVAVENLEDKYDGFEKSLAKLTCEDVPPSLDDSDDGLTRDEEMSEKAAKELADMLAGIRSKQSGHPDTDVPRDSQKPFQSNEGKNHDNRLAVGKGEELRGEFETDGDRDDADEVRNKSDACEENKAEERKHPQNLSQGKEGNDHGSRVAMDGDDDDEECNGEHETDKDREDGDGIQPTTDIPEVNGEDYSRREVLEEDYCNKDHDDEDNKNAGPNKGGNEPPHEEKVPFEYQARSGIDDSKLEACELYAPSNTPGSEVFEALDISSIQGGDIVDPETEKGIERGDSEQSETDVERGVAASANHAEAKNIKWQQSQYQRAVKVFSLGIGIFLLLDLILIILILIK